MLVTELTSQSEISAMKWCLSLNRSDMSVTSDTFQPSGSHISFVPAAPQSAPRLQHSTPLRSTARQLSTACLSASPSAKGEGSVGELTLHMALSVRVPALHDLVPERVYPESQVGLHDIPCASVEVHPEPGAPFVMAPDASHKGASTRVLSSIEDPPESAVSG